jgi:daunorubicin/doxorubicin transport system ATP-binding protein
MEDTSRLTQHDPAVETSGLTKLFGDKRVLDGVDLAIPRGTVYGLLGPNGAGKTTTIRILATLLRPDGGAARVFGHDVVREASAVRRGVSLTAQFASVDEDLTAVENLVLLARLLGFSRSAAKERARELLDAFDLADAAGRRVEQFSGGMRRRLDIAASLIVRPGLLFLDEPTTGLDPRSRNQVWEMVRAIVAEGTTVLLTTQYLDEADQLADRIAVIDNGRVIAEGTRGELKASVGAGSVKVRLLDPQQRDQAEDLLSNRLGVPVYRERDPASLITQIPSSAGAEEAGLRVAQALAELSRSGIAVGDFALGQPSLDEVFLALTGSRADAHDPETEGEYAKEAAA